MSWVISGRGPGRIPISPSVVGRVKEFAWSLKTFFSGVTISSRRDTGYGAGCRLSGLPENFVDRALHVEIVFVDVI